MSIEKEKGYFNRVPPQKIILEFSTSSATVQLFATALGRDEDRKIV